MIPKIIHYCWFGKADKPESVQDCLSGWQRILPDYKIVEWNETNFDYQAFDFTREAYAMGKYAFVSDVARLFALYQYGGIYLDTDVRILKSFDPFLSHSSFLGKEFPLGISTAVIGSLPRLPWVKHFMETYTPRGKHFILKNGSIDQTTNTALLSDFINHTWHLYKNDIAIFPEDYFCCKSYFTGEITITDNSVAVHDFACSWVGQEQLTIWNRFRNLLKRMIKCKRPKLMSCQKS